ncbi:MAG: right-handed parallel beta-helix repeat-containing protein [Opitutaceae bacterium]|nr:right-handed parallel beta-helix repeat-containing protein [Opitutaceae bacterium]
MKPFCLRIAFVLALGGDLRAVEFHVAPDGNDTNPGHAERPFATLERAQAAIRTLKRTVGLPPGGVTVHVRGGTYTLPAPLTLTPEDSGSAEAPIVFTGDEARPLLSAGRKITGWRPIGDGVWAADLPEVKAGRWYFEQLFINDRRATRARSPNDGYFYVDLKGGYGPEPETGNLVDLSRRSFRVLRDGDLSDYSNLSGAALRDVTLTVLWNNWISTKVRVAAVEPSLRLVTLTGAPGSSTHSDFDRGIRYFVENCRAAFDAPGEWFLDRGGTLLYRPRPQEDMTTAEVFAPRWEQFIIMAGDPKAGRYVEHVTFRGLRFQHAACPIPPGGMPEKQSAATVPAAILADGARHVRLVDCEIAHIGGYAIHFRYGCRDCTVTQCYLHDLGAGGVHLGGGEQNQVPAEWEQSSHLEVDNNILRAGGRVYPSGSAILSHHCSDSRFTHNYISDFYYSGISAGWTWSYLPSLAKRNEIAFNHISHIGQGILSDLAGIYTLGESQGTTIVGNVIHDVHCYSYGAAGIYNDQASTGIRVANNLTYRSETSGYTMNFGKDVTIENNIFALTETHVLHKGTGREESSANFTRNILWFDRGELLEGGWRAPAMRVARNLYWDASRRPVTFLGLSWGKWRELGKDEGSFVADPLFVNPARWDFRLRPGSPAAKIGFVPFDESQAGVRGEGAWRALARSFPAPALPPRPPVPKLTPLRLDEDFESTPIDWPPAIAKIEPTWAWQQYGLRVAVAAEPSPSGQRCLKMVENKPGLQTWAPMLIYYPAHREGQTRLSFDIKLDRASHLTVSMEDRTGKNVAPLNGPFLDIREGRLFVAGRPPVTIPWNQWIKLELVAGIGSQATGTFDLEVTLPDGTKHGLAGIKCRSRNWNHLQWLGFSSVGDGDSTILLDNIHLANLPAVPR